MSVPAIEFCKVSKSFDESVLLSEIDFSVFSGESLVVIGPSGQGKSVLLKMMSGILEPTTGKVLVEGNNLYSRGASRRKQMQKMGMLFQKNALFDSLTCAENIAFPLREATELSDQEIEQKVRIFLEEVDIAHAYDLYPDEISGGMQKRLGIARALALRPEIIFYDDPTAGLDPITSRRIVKLILRLKEEYQSTVVAVTNDMNRAFQMADRIAMVVDGHFLLCGSVEETKNHPDPRVQQFIRGSLKGPLTQDFAHQEI